MFDGISQGISYISCLLKRMIEKDYFNRLTENGVKEFKVKLSKTLNGSWDTVLDETLVNNRGQLMSQSDPFPVKQFRFKFTRILRPLPYQMYV